MGGFLVVVLLSLLGIVLANDQFNIFSSPPEGSFLTWRAGTTQTVSWTTACQTGYNITLWQQAAEGGSASLIAVIYSMQTLAQPLGANFLTRCVYSREQSSSGAPVVFLGRRLGRS
jgi:hypothetical protein